MANAATLQIAREIRQTLAGRALTERQAKLYSQRLRREMSQEGLASFAPGDVDVYLDEVILLIQCNLEHKADPASAWRDWVKRGAEILEWLSQSSLKPTVRTSTPSCRSRVSTRRLSSHGAGAPAPRARRSVVFGNTTGIVNRYEVRALPSPLHLSSGWVISI